MARTFSGMCFSIPFGHSNRDDRFEAFDESWKDQPNEPGNAWGLMDASRKLKPGLKIPDCGGKTVS